MPLTTDPRTEVQLGTEPKQVAQSLTTVPDAPPMVADKMPSALDELRAEFAKEAEERSLFKRLPARNERLVAEYKTLPLADAKKAIENESDPTMLIASLKGIYIHDAAHASANDRGLVPLGLWSEKPQLDPLGFDKRLTDLIGIPYGSATQIVLFLFEDNDLALAAQSGELGEWSIKTKREDLQDFAIGS